MNSEMNFERTLQSLDQIFDFINAFMVKAGIPQSQIFPIQLAVEELFTNWVKYQADSPHDIAIALDNSHRKLIVTLTDPDCERFDLRNAPEPAIHQPLSDRKPGGLGIHLVKKMVDTVDYTYVNRKSTITLTKYLES